MEKIKQQNTFEVLMPSQINKTIQQLLAKADETLQKANAKYSDFKVGAALLLENGQIITGNNQENSSYPSGLCAERVAIFYANSQFPGLKITALAINISPEKRKADLVYAPCGACRQVLMDYEISQKQTFPVYFPGKNNTIYKSQSVESLLPFPFIF